MKTKKSSSTSVNGGGGEKKGSADFLVVGIGASAGGIQALSEFFANVDRNSGAAYVVILHLSPDHESKLAEVLQQVAPIPVTQVTKRTKIGPDHVYVVSPNKSLAMQDGHIDLNPIETVEERRAPVDIFFRTLADSHGANAVGVILSGTGADGSMGLKRIKEYGGATFVQNPREAEFNEMPRNSIATELVDSILPVAEIPAHIANYRSRLGQISIPDEPEQRPDEQQNALREVFTQLRVRTGHDFSNYKRPTMLRRIERRISVRNLPDIQAYAAFLRDNPEESQALLKDLLISVTNFFRDKKAFEAVETVIFPRILKQRRADQPVRIWVAGCATGEEAYSLAMIAAEQTSNSAEAPPIQIFATDIDETAINIAREGVYTLNDAADVSPERLRRFFTREGESYRVRREIRETVLFAQHNLLKDPPFSRLDLATCRNLLIYFNPSAQERVMETMHFALNPGGFLFIGSSESVDGAGDLFAPVSKENHIFQSRHATSRPLPVPETSPAYRSAVNKLVETEKKFPAAPDRITYNELHLRLLEEFAPPSVVVNQDHEIVHLSEKAGRYLQVAGGEPSNNLLKLIRPELRIELRTALFQAVQQRKNVEVRGLKVNAGAGTDGQEEKVNLLIRPVVNTEDSARGFVLVVFEPAGEIDQAVPVDYAQPEPAAQQLEEELIRSRAQLRSSLEQSEIQSEELRASNEELQAMNEELRSSAEELETSTEELQSVNEELSTVNQELKIKIEELSQSNDDFQNLMNSTDIGTIFLDRNLRIKMFTPTATEVFNLIPADINRPLSDITSRVKFEEMVADVTSVLDTLQTAEREFETPNGFWYLMRIFPYRTAEHRIDGVVIAFFDITGRIKSEQELRAAREELEFALDSASMGIWQFDLVAHTAQTDLRHNRIFGYAEQVKAWNPEIFKQHVLPEDQPVFDAAFAKALEAGDLDMQVRIKRRDGKICWIYDRGRVQYDLARRPVRIAGVTLDITEAKRSEESIRLQAQLLDSVEQSVIATDLDGKVIFWNRFAEKSFGWAEEEALGRPIMELTTPDVVTEQGNEIMALLRSNRSWEGEFPVRRRDGSTFMAHLVNSPVTDATGNLIGIVGISFDLEERRQMEAALRQSEERLRLLMESFTDYAILTMDKESIVENWNPGAEKIFGYTAEEIIGQPADIVFTPEDRAGGAPDKERLSARENGRASDERWHLRKDGSRFFASGVMVPLFDRGTLLGYAKIARDLTGQKRVAEQLQQSREQLERRVAERTDELNRSNEALREEVGERKKSEDERVRLLRRIVTTQEDERRRIAREIHDQLGQRLTALRLKIAAVKDLCKDQEELCERMARLEELGAALDSEVSFLAWELRPAVLDDLGLAAAIENYVREWSQHFEIPTELHTTGIKRRRFERETETNLYRITQEALNNIAKHSRATSANVLLELRKKELILIVEDNGLGFEPKKQTRGKQSGRGLGLVGMRERAGICGGGVEIESAKGKGTTVFVRVPAKFAQKGGKDGD